MLNTSRRYILTILIAITAIVGSWQIGHAAYIHAKAQLAQFLLLRAWQKTLESGQAIKPWPWADTWPIARLVVPAHDIDLIVLAGDSGRTLAFGPGYQFGSAMPGDIGNTIISAHRDTHFTFLKLLVKGDRVKFYTRTSQTLEYSVDDLEVVDSRTTALNPDADISIITLVTCYPFESITPGGPLRFVALLTQVTAL